MKKSFLVFLIFFNNHVFAQAELTPKGFAVLDEKVGDLDRDGIDEKVIVYDTSDTTEDGIVREIRILKFYGNKWNVWKSSRNAILKSKEGGMMGDPFAEINIDKGLLLISMAGGSSWKWSYTDKYRFQGNNFKLVGYLSHYGKPCEYWGDFDFNLSTGKIIARKEYEDCEKKQMVYKKEYETFFKKGISIDLNNRNLKKYKIISPKSKRDYYL
jgi:hypothetical protein